MAHSDSLKDWLYRNPDAKIVDAVAGDYDTEPDTDEETSWTDSIAHSSKEIFEEGTEYIKQGTEYASERLKIAKEAADKYTTRAFKNLRRSVLETIMSDGGPNSASRKVRRQMITAVLGEEAWKDVESQYDIVGPAWDDAEAVTRGLRALELGDSNTFQDEWDAWKHISPSSRATFLDIPQRIQWLEKEGYITGSSYEPDYLPMVVAWVYFGFLIILAYWAVKWFWEVWIWVWSHIRYDEFSGKYEETPPKKRRRMTVKKPTRDIMRPKQYGFDVKFKVEKRVKDEFVPKSKKSAIVVYNAYREAKLDPGSLYYYQDDSQYTEDEGHAQYSYVKEEEEQHPDSVNNGYSEWDAEAPEEYDIDEEEGYRYGDREEYYGPEDQLELEAVTPQQPTQGVNATNSYQSSASVYAENTETEDYIGQDEDYQELEEEGIYENPNKEGGYEDDEEYSIVEEEVPKTTTVKFKTKPKQQPDQHHSRVPASKALPSGNAPENAPARPSTKASRAQQTMPPQKRR